MGSIGFSFITAKIKKKLLFIVLLVSVFQYIYFSYYADAAKKNVIYERVYLPFYFLVDNQYYYGKKEGELYLKLINYLKTFNNEKEIVLVSGYNNWYALDDMTPLVKLYGINNISTFKLLSEVPPKKFLNNMVIIMGNYGKANEKDLVTAIYAQHHNIGESSEMFEKLERINSAFNILDTGFYLAEKFELYQTDDIIMKQQFTVRVYKKWKNLN